MLAGITDITIQGKFSDVKWAQTHLANGESLGITLSYGEQEERNENVSGTMHMRGLSFLYGKDLTKTFRRVLYGATVSYYVGKLPGDSAWPPI